MRRLLLTVTAAAAITAGCTGEDDADVAALGELEPDSCLPIEPPEDPPGAVTGVTSDDEEILDELATQVADIRDLEWVEDLVTLLLEPGRLGEVIEMVRTPDPLDVERRLLVAVGAAPADLDLQAAVIDHETSRAGYYFWEPPQAVAAQETAGELTPLERLVLAHEYTHALADQAVGMPRDAMVGTDGDTDASLAAHALVEGEAMLLERLWAFLHLTAEDRPERLEQDIFSAVDSDLPHLVQRRNAFPYDEGLAMVCDAYREGGWDAVNSLYEDPPATTAEVITGTEVEVAAPPEVTAPGEPGIDWTDIGNTTVGVAELAWHFEAPGNDTDAALDEPLERALAWAGGEVTVWTDTTAGDTDLVALALRDNGATATPLCDSIDAWQTAAFPDAKRTASGSEVVFDRGDSTAVLHCDGDEVVLAVAPEEQLALEVAGADR